MHKIYIRYHKTSLGELMLGSFHGRLCLCDWSFTGMRNKIDKRIQDGLAACFEVGETLITQNAGEQLEEYFSGNRTDFDVPLLMVGTSFQKRVWSELLKIPCGKTETYLGLSRKIGDERAIRSVAAANGANAISIFIPCHRIIGSDGRLTGYRGGLQAKRELLQMERHHQASHQLQLFG